MSERNVTVHLSVDVKVEGDAPAQEIAQRVAAEIALPTMRAVPRCSGSLTTITPLRLEVERAHEKGGA